MTNLLLDDSEATALTTLLTYTLDVAPFPLSERVQTLRAILVKLRAEPARQLTPQQIARHRHR